MLKVDDRDQIGEISRKIRQIIMEVEIPSDVANAVAHYLSEFGEEHALMQCVPVQLQKIYHMPPLQVNRIPI